LNAWEGPGVINAQTDAATEPAVFSPLCGLKGSMILRGGSCQVDFGWYCADDAPGKEVIHPLVSGADMVRYHDVVLKSPAFAGSPPGFPNRTWYDVYNNQDKAFVPTVQMGQIQPVEGAGSLAAIREDPAFLACKSGRIGFAFRGNPTSFCPQSKFSEQSRNEATTFGGNWVNALVYASRKRPGVFYIAFEDLPTRPQTFSPLLTELKQFYPTMKQPSGWDGSNDGDFNDFVFTVEGIVCEGGGQYCETGKPGVCNAGVTQCSVGDSTEEAACQQSVEAADEKCDNLDNDCDGEVDEGDLCAAKGVGFRCFEGQCVAPCSSGEFACPGNTECDSKTDLCVPLGCGGVTCKAGSVCRKGECVGGCDGVTCGGGQVCVLGRCVDPCATTKCPDGFACKNGACIASCDCLPCAKGFACQADGTCLSEKCVGVKCTTGQKCDEETGACVDRCEGVVCPGGARCLEGACLPGAEGGAGGNEPPPLIEIPATGGTGNSAGSGAGNSGNSAGLAPADKSGCNCRVGDGTSRSAAGWVGLLVGLALLRFRRRPH
jgi:MYXO-CTERM domain-containing protein